MSLEKVDDHLSYRKLFRAKDEDVNEAFISSKIQDSLKELFEIIQQGSVNLKRAFRNNSTGFCKS